MYFQHLTKCWHLILILCVEHFDQYHNAERYTYMCKCPFMDQIWIWLGKYLYVNVEVASQGSICFENIA